MSNSPTEDFRPAWLTRTLRGPLTIGSRVQVSPRALAGLDCNPEAYRRVKALRGTVSGFKLNPSGLFVRVLWHNADLDHMSCYQFTSYSFLTLCGD